MALFLYRMHSLPPHKCKESGFTIAQSRINRAKTLWVASSSSNNKKKQPRPLSFGERLLDYIEGGPKLRKWYGAPDQLPRDGLVGNKEDRYREPEQETVPEVRDAVLVTDGDSKTGQMGMLAEDENLKGIEHIILLSQLAVLRSGGGIQAFMNEKAKRLAEADEIAVINSGVPYTIVRAGSLQDKPGNQRGFNFKEGCAGNGTLSREDAAAICVESLDSPAKKGLVFEVVNGEETVQNWNELFSSLANSGNQE